MVEQHPLVSVVVTTRNEERNIVNCLKSIAAQTWPNIEMIVIDNQSTDKTKELARRFTDKVFDKGPERSAQRNFGIIEVATGEYAMFVDADMLLTPSLVEKCVKTLREANGSGLHIEEVVLGRGLLARIRRFERGFYSGTVIDGIRFFRRDLFISLGGFDQSLPPGPEDWDLDKRFKLCGQLVLVSEFGGHLSPELQAFVGERGVAFDPGYVGIYHNEDEQSLRQYVKKKAYYSGSMSDYVAKWGREDPDVTRQLGVRYRYATVFLENAKWQRVARHPILTVGMISLRVIVGATYILSARRRSISA